jgi:hypothetical protein
MKKNVIQPDRPNIYVAFLLDNNISVIVQPDDNAKRKEEFLSSSKMITE